MSVQVLNYTSGSLFIQLDGKRYSIGNQGGTGSLPITPTSNLHIGNGQIAYVCDVSSMLNFYTSGNYIEIFVYNTSLHTAGSYGSNITYLFMDTGANVSYMGTTSGPTNLFTSGNTFNQYLAPIESNIKGIVTDVITNAKSIVDDAKTIITTNSATVKADIAKLNTPATITGISMKTLLIILLIIIVIVIGSVAIFKILKRSKSY